MKNVFIIGAGGHALVVKSILELNGIIIDGFIDKSDENTKLLDIDKDATFVAIAIGDNDTREKVFERVKKLGIEIISVIHPKSIISTDAVLGNGVVVCAGAIICTKAKIGDNTIINTGSTIDHEAIIGKNCHIAPGVHIAGKVNVGDNTLIGIGSSVIPNIKIGKKSIIGAGAVVIEDIPDNCVAAGVPAKVIKTI